MSNRIQGISVEIGGDTTKLSVALSGVNKDIRSTQSELKDVNRLLKLDPSNAELISQKQKMLAQSISDTKDKLTQLKAVQDQMDEGLKNGSVTQTQYDAWQREIISTEEELKKLKDQVRNTDDAISATLKQVGSKFSDVGSKVSGVGTKMTTGITTPVVALGTASLAAFKSVDDGMDTIVTKTGASGAALDDMQRRAKNVAETIPTSFEDAGTAVGEISRTFGQTGDYLEELTKNFIEFSSINDTDLAPSINKTQMVMSQFNMKTSDVGCVLGLLTDASHNTGLSVDTLFDLLEKNGPTFKEMGLDVGSAVTLMSAFQVSGLDSSTMLAGLKKAAANYSKEGESMSDGLSSLSDRLMDSSTAADATAEAYDIFGAKGALAFITAAKEGKIGLTGLSTDISKYGDTVDKTYQATLDGIDQSTMALNALKDAGSQVGEALGNTLAPILKQVAGYLKEFAAWFSSLSPGMKDMIVKIGLIAAAVGPVVLVVGKVIGAIGSIITALGTVTGVIGTISSAIPAVGTAMAALTGPVGIVIAIIAAVVAAGVLLVKNWDSIKEACGRIWGAVRDFFSGVWDAMKNTAESAVSAIKSALDTAWSGISTVVQNVWSGISSFFSGIWDGITNIFTMALDAIKSVITTVFDGISSFISSAMNAIKNVIETVWNAIKDVVTSVVSGIKDFLTGAFEAIKNAVSSAMETIKSVFTTAWEAIKTTVVAVIDGIKSAVTAAFEGIKSAVETISHAIESVVTGIWNSIKGAVVSAADGIKNGVCAAWNAVKDTVTNVLETIKGACGNAFKSMWEGIKSVMSDIGNAVKDGFGTVGDFMKNLASTAFGWGKDLIEGIVNGIRSCIDKVRDAVSNVADTIRSFLHFSVPDEGPLVDYESWMPDFMSGIAGGIEQGRDMIKQAMRNTAGDMVLSPRIAGITAPEVTGNAGVEGASALGGNDSLGTKLDDMNALMRVYLPKMADSKVILDSGVLVGELSDGVNRHLGRAYS